MLALLAPLRSGPPGLAFVNARQARFAARNGEAGDRRFKILDRR